MKINEVSSHELKRVITSQHIFFAVRITAAVVIPALIFGYLGYFKEMYLFPIGTSFLALVDQPGPVVRRRNTLLGAMISFLVVALVAVLSQGVTMFVYLEIILFGIFFSMLGVYGPRLGGLGAMSLIVLAIFVDGSLVKHAPFLSILIFIGGGVWYFILLLTLSKIQPYKLARQMIGENYLILAEYLRIKSELYDEKKDIDVLVQKLSQEQILLKNVQEQTRDLMFRTRKFINESTTTSRLLTFQFVSSIDLFEQLNTSESSYKNIREKFHNHRILKDIKKTLEALSKELMEIGVQTQSGIISKVNERKSNRALARCFKTYQNLRQEKMNADNLDDFMMLKQIMVRVKKLSNEIEHIHLSIQNEVSAKSLSSGLDVTKFTPSEKPLNFKVLKNSFSLESVQFRHALRLTIAMVIGYTIAKLEFHGFGHSYWVLITLVAIMKPGYGLTKKRNLLRLGGTFLGGAVGTAIIWLQPTMAWQMSFIIIAMIACYSMLRVKYFWAILFMTIYVLLAFNFLHPTGFSKILGDRLFDTALAGVVAFVVSYFILPVWEYKQTQSMLLEMVSHNAKYFKEVFRKLRKEEVSDEKYRLLRKNSIIALANLSDHFQRLMTEPKNQQKNLELLRQFVNTSHLKTAYISSLAQYLTTGREYPEIDFLSWEQKIFSEFDAVTELLESTPEDTETKKTEESIPNDTVDELIFKRKEQLKKDTLEKATDIAHISRVAELKNIQEILYLIYATSKEQRKLLQRMYIKRDN